MPHIHEKIDFCVEVFIVHRDKVLLRMHDKHHIWLSVGRHIELDEDPIQAAVREVKEEVGLNVKIFGQVSDTKKEADYQPLPAPAFLGCHEVNSTHKHVVLVYFATASSNKISEAVMKHERTDIIWATKKDLLKMDLRPNVRFYAEQALRVLGKNK